MTYKYSFFDDYSEGAHPQILQALVNHNNPQALGYGVDVFSLKAADLIREKIDNSNAAVYFVCSGTQANLVGISWLLKSYESIISAQTGHICVHESGAIEATGHKVHAEPAEAGKLSPEIIQKLVDAHDMDQMVLPRAVYISQSTEGTWKFLGLFMPEWTLGLFVFFIIASIFLVSFYNNHTNNNVKSIA
jgi:threonine aldolase